MFARMVKIHNRTGLHARPATLFVETANQFTSTISVANGEQEVDARSVLGLMLLEAIAGVEITVKAQGEDEVAAVNSLVGLVERSFDEGEPQE